MAQLKTLKFNDNVVAKSNGSYFSDAPLVFQENGTDSHTSLSPAGLVTNGDVEVTSESGHIIVRDDTGGNTIWIAMSGGTDGGSIYTFNGDGNTVVSLETNCGNGHIGLGDSCGTTRVEVYPNGMHFSDSCGLEALSFVVQSGFHMEFGTDGSTTPLVIEGGTTYNGGFDIWYGDDPSQSDSGEYSRFQMYDHTIELTTEQCGDYSFIQLEPDRVMIDASIVVSSGRTLTIWHDEDSEIGMNLAGGDSGMVYYGSSGNIKLNGYGLSVIPQDYSSDGIQLKINGSSEVDFVMSGGAIIYNHKQLQFNNDGTVTWTQA